MGWAGRFADAFEADDIDGVVALLTEDAWLTMPPAALEYPGPSCDRVVPPCECHLARRSEVPARAHPRQHTASIRLYVPDTRAAVADAAGLIVLTLEGSRISAITRFLDQRVLLRIELPRVWHD